MKKYFYGMGGDTPELDAQRSGRYHISGNIQSQMALMQLKMSLLTAEEGLDQMTFQGPFQPKLLYESMACLTEEKDRCDAQVK